MLQDAPRDMLAPLLSLRTLSRHWPWVMLLVALSTLLTQGALHAQVRLGLPQTLEAEAMVQLAGLIPVELYLLPRFLLMADARDLDLPSNPAATWRTTFEARWGALVLAKVLLGLLVGVGLALFVVPGVLVMLFFGWAPHRVLLRGESLLDAARGSARMMAGAWPRVLLVSGATALGFLMVMGGLAIGVGLLKPDPSLHTRMTHPLFWVLQAVSALMGLWVSAAFLALFQGVENAAPTPPESED